MAVKMIRAKSVSTGKTLIALSLLALLLPQISARAQDRPTLHRRPRKPPNDLGVGDSARSSFPAGLAFVGDRFVTLIGDLYWFGPNDTQLTPFAPISVPFHDPDPYFEHSLETSLPGLLHPIATSLGLGEFPCGGIYVGAGNNILHLSKDGTKIDLFAAHLDGSVRTLLFDMTGTFRHNLLVGTSTGALYLINLINEKASAKRLTTVGENIGGMDIVPLGSGFGPLDGQLIVVSEKSGRLRAVNPQGITTDIDLVSDPHLFSVEGLFMVPRDLGSSGKPDEEGFYSILWPDMIYQSGIENLQALKGDVLITTLSGVAKHWRLHWNGSGFELIEVETFEDRVQAELLVTPTLVKLGETCSSHNPKSANSLSASTATNSPIF